MQFGKSSEKLREKTQRQVREAEERINALQEELAETLGEQHDPALPQPLRQSSARKPLPATVPRETRVLPPQESACPACGGGLSPLGCDISEQLELISSAFKVIETQRPKLSCCRCDSIVQSPMPSKPIERSYVGPGLLARIVTAKFAEHTPHYRQSEIYRRQGVELSRATLGRWSGAVSELLEPLYDLLREYVLMPGKVHTDDIPVPVQAPGSGKTRTGRLWVYVRDDRNAGSVMPAAAWFAYSPDRKGLHPQLHLAGYSGVLQADAYVGYNALYENGRITEAACMAHARRKIHDVHVRTPTDITTEALRRIGELYAIEVEIRGSPAEKRLSVRKVKTVPRMQSLYDWIQTQMKTLSRHAEIAKAFAYLLKLEAVGCVDPLLRERLGGNRQQHRGERPARSRAGAKKLALRRVRCRRRACSDTVLADRHVQTEWRGTGGVAALRHRTYPGLAGESSTRSVALESRPHLILKRQYGSNVTLTPDTTSPARCGCK